MPRGIVEQSCPSGYTSADIDLPPHSAKSVGPHLNVHSPLYRVTFKAITLRGQRGVATNGCIILVSQKVSGCTIFSFPPRNSLSNTLPIGRTKTQDITIK